MTSMDFLEAIGEIKEAYILEACNVTQMCGKHVRNKNTIIFFRRVIKYVSAAAATICCAVVLLNPSVVAEAKDSLVRWFDNHVVYHFQREGEETSIPRYVLGYVPEGYREGEANYYGDRGMAVYHRKDLKENISFVYGRSDGELEVPGDGRVYRVLEAEDGAELHYLEAEDGSESSLTWLSRDERVLFTISGRLSLDEFLKMQGSVKEAENIMAADQAGNSYEDLIASLSEDQAYAFWQAEELAEPVLLVATGTYEIDGCNAAIDCSAYCMEDGRVRLMGEICSGGTAYPLAWDGEAIYAAGGHFVERYVPDGEGALVLDNAVRYIAAEESYRMVRSAEVTENFTRDGDVFYSKNGERLEEEEGEALLLKLFDVYHEAEIFDFVK